MLRPLLTSAFSVQLNNAFAFFFQIIMARPAGGPKPPQGKKDFDEDD